MKTIRLEKIKKIAVKALVFGLSFLVGMFIAKATKAQDAKSLLWKIEGKELESPSYLYGTVHMICKDDFLFTDAIKQALEETEQTVLELDMDDPQFMTKAQQGSLNAGMKNISDEYSEEDKAVVNEFMKTHYGATLAQLGIVKPFALLSMVVQKTITCEASTGYEQTFVENAKARGIEVNGLETIEFQTGIFDNTPMKDQIALLVTSIKDFEEGKADFAKMIAAYKEQDLIKLRNFMTESPEYAAYEDLLINDRNKDWIPKIGEMASEKPTFFAVGALHLGGEEGVIKLLQKAGYKVTPVANNSL